VANVLSRLGYDPVWQDIFGTEPGDLRRMLRDKIDDCDGLIHLVGHGYGAEPPELDPDFGRISYTQFEFLHARKQGKKTWIILAEDGCARDTPLGQLDLPADPAHPDPTGYQAERRVLQDAWRRRLKDECDLWHEATSDTELELKVERLKDEFAELRKKFAGWQQSVTQAQSLLKRRTALSLATVLIVLVLLVIGGRALFSRVAPIDEKRIRSGFVKTIGETYQKQLLAAEELTEWEKRDAAKKTAAETRERRLGQVDEFLTSITSTIQTGEASPEFLELPRIIPEEGAVQALAYITSKEARLLDEAEQLTQQKRRKLAPKEFAFTKRVRTGSGTLAVQKTAATGRRLARAVAPALLDSDRTLGPSHELRNGCDRFGQLRSGRKVRTATRRVGRLQSSLAARPWSLLQLSGQCLHWSWAERQTRYATMRNTSESLFCCPRPIPATRRSNAISPSCSANWGTSS
jgi:hypothetical protein